MGDLPFTIYIYIIFKVEYDTKFVDAVTPFIAIAELLEFYTIYNIPESTFASRSEGRGDFKKKKKGER